MKEGIKVCFVFVFLLVNITLVVTQTCTTLDVICTCDDYNTPLVSNYANCYQPDVPSRKYSVPTSYLINSGASQRYETLFNTNIIAFENLYGGVVYEFSTCSRPTPSDPGFDAVLVLRAPNGQILAANDNCDMYNPPPTNDIPCSYLIYPHFSNEFDTVYLSIYPKRISPKGEVMCNVNTGRNSVTIYAGAVNDYFTGGTSGNIDCSPKLICKESATVDAGTFIFFSDLITSQSDLCNLFPDYFIGDEQVNYIDCDLLGTHIVTVKIYGLSCEIEMTIVNPSPSYSCAANNGISYPTELSSKCQYTGGPCFIDPIDYVPNIYFNSLECDNAEFEYEVTYNERLPLLGSTVLYDITEIFSGSGVSCFQTFYGIQPYSLFRYGHDDEPLFDDSTLFFDTVYIISYYAEYPDLGSTYDVNIEVLAATGESRFAPGSEGQSNLQEFPYYYNNDCIGIDDSCQSFSAFCVPSTYEYYYDFETPLEIVLKGEYINNLSYPPSSFSPLNPSIVYYNGNSKKRDSSNFIISLGNPRAYFTHATNLEDRDNSCEQFGISWDQGPLPS